jgi:hypothetical protein
MRRLSDQFEVVTMTTMLVAVVAGTCHEKGRVGAVTEATRYEVVKVTHEPCACCREVQWVAAGPMSYREAVEWISKKVDWHPYDIRCRETGRFSSFEQSSEACFQQSSAA